MAYQGGPYGTGTNRPRRRRRPARRSIASTRGRGIAQTVGRRAPRRRIPTHLYTPISRQGRKSTPRKVVTRKGRAHVTKQPYRPNPKRVISHRAVQRAKRRERQRVERAVQRSPVVGRAVRRERATAGGGLLYTPLNKQGRRGQRVRVALQNSGTGPYGTGILGPRQARAVVYRGRYRPDWERAYQPPPKKRKGGVLPFATALPGALVDEAGKTLHGTGLLAKGAGKLGGALAFVTGGNEATAKISVKGYSEGPLGRANKNAAHEVVDIPANIVPSVYHFATTKPSKQWRDFKNQSAVALAAQGRFKEAAKAFEQHPLTTALELSGGKAAVGRGSGAVLRRAPSKRAREYATTRRSPARVPGTEQKVRRTYSPDLITKRAQVAHERRQVRRATELRRKADNEDRPDLAEAYRRKANRIDPRVAKDKHVRRAVDVEQDVANVVSRQNRDRVAVEIAGPRRSRKLGRRTDIRQRDAAAVVQVAQAVTKPTRADLKAYRAEIDREYHQGALRASTKEERQALAPKRRANRELVKALDRVIDDPKADYGRVKAAADRYVAAVLPRQRELVRQNILPAASEAGVLKPYAVRNMGARFDDDAGVLLDRKGVPLSNDRIKQHMRNNGVDPEAVAYVSHVPGQNPRGAFYQPPDRVPTVSGPVRTGRAVTQGLARGDRDILVESASRMQTMIDRNRGFSRFVGPNALRGKDGTIARFPDKRQADDAKRQAEANGDDFEVVRLQPFAAKGEQIDALLSGMKAADLDTHKSVLSALREALDGTDGPGPWTLVDARAVTRLQEHLNQLGPNSGARAVQAVFQQFRQAVLYTSTKWLTGNVAEAGLRMAVKGAVPGHHNRVFRKTMDRLEQQAFEEHRGKGLDVEEAAATAKAERAFAEAHAVPGGQFTMASRTIHRSADQWVGTAFEKPARALERFAQAPGPKHLSGAWKVWGHVVADQVNNRLESFAQRAIAGRYIRQELMDSRLLQSFDNALNQAASGLRHTHEQVALGENGLRVYGQYARFSPAKKAFVVQYTPFVPWALNAFRFIYQVLPVDHPMMTAILVAESRLAEDWREAHGLTKFGKGRLPNFLQGSIPSPGGGSYRVSRYTPFGLVSQGVEDVPNFFLPQFSNGFAALKGEDWRGNPLHNDDGTELTDTQRIFRAIYETGKGTVPFAGPGSRLLEGDSLNKIFNPAAPTEPGRKKKSGSGGSRRKTPADELQQLRQGSSSSAADELQKLRSR